MGSAQEHLNDAVTTLRRIADDYDIAIVMWTREDIERAYDRELTDDEWQTIIESKAWRDVEWIDDYNHPSEYLDLYEAEDGWPALDVIVKSPSGWSFRAEQENGDEVACQGCGNALDDDYQIANDMQGFAYHVRCLSTGREQ